MSLDQFLFSSILCWEIGDKKCCKYVNASHFFWLTYGELRREREGERDQSPSVVTLYDNRSLEITAPFMTQKAASPLQNTFDWLIFLNRPTRRDSPINDLEKKTERLKRGFVTSSLRIIKVHEKERNKKVKVHKNQKSLLCDIIFLIYAPPSMEQLFWTFDPMWNVWPHLTKLDQIWPNLTKIDQNFWVPFFDRFDANVAITNTFYFITFLISCLKVSQTDKNETPYHAVLTMVLSSCSHQKCGIHLTFFFCLIQTHFEFWLLINFEPSILNFWILTTKSWGSPRAPGDFRRATSSARFTRSFMLLLPWHMA